MQPNSPAFDAVMRNYRQFLTETPNRELTRQEQEFRNLREENFLLNLLNEACIGLKTETLHSICASVWDSRLSNLTTAIDAAKMRPTLWTHELMIRCRLLELYFKNRIYQYYHPKEPLRNDLVHDNFDIPKWSGNNPLHQNLHTEIIQLSEEKPSR